jgi:hypothetical protein
MRKWTDEQTETMPQREQFASVVGYRWSRLALFLDANRTAPEFLPDETIDDTINAAWETRPYLCE